MEQWSCLTTQQTINEQNRTEFFPTQLNIIKIKEKKKWKKEKKKRNRGRIEEHNEQECTDYTGSRS
jgi:hypothetical protein